MNYLTEIEHDVLKEVMSIGAGSAAAALSTMIKKNVVFTVPNLWLIPIEEVSGLMGGIEQIMTILAVKISGDVSGVVLYLLTDEDGIKLADAVSSLEKNAVLEETFNIIIGASLTALSNFLKMSLIQSVPASASDMLRAVINEIIAQMGEQTDQILLLKANFQVDEIGVNGDLYYLFNPSSSKKILQACNVSILKNNG